MDIITAALVCLRRWYVFLPVVVVGALLAAKGYSGASFTYEARGAVIVLPNGLQGAEPPSKDGSLRINPYALSGGTRLLSVVLANNLVSAEVKGQIRAQVPGTDYSTASSRTNPIVTITATGPTSEAAVKAVGAVVTQAEPVVRTIQLEAGSPESKLYSASSAEPTSLTSVAAPGRLKSAIASLLVAVALAGMLSILVDVLLTRRAVRAPRVAPPLPSPSRTQNPSPRPQAPSHHAKKTPGRIRLKGGRDEDRVAVP